MPAEPKGSGGLSTAEYAADGRALRSGDRVVVRDLRARGVDPVADPVVAGGDRDGRGEGEVDPVRGRSGEDRHRGRDPDEGAGRSAVVGVDHRAHLACPARRRPGSPVSLLTAAGVGTLYGPETSRKLAPPLEVDAPIVVVPNVCGGALAWTTAVGSEVAMPAPEPFVAVTRTRTVWPTSLAVSVYAPAVAEPIAVQPAPPRVAALPLVAEGGVVGPGPGGRAQRLPVGGRARDRRQDAVHRGVPDRGVGGVQRVAGVGRGPEDRRRRVAAGRVRDGRVALGVRDVVVRQVTVFDPSQ